MADAKVSAKASGNQATIIFPPPLEGRFAIDTSSYYYQFVTVEINGNSKTYSGKGNWNTIAVEKVKGSAQPIKLTFEFSSDGKDGKRKPSKVQVEEQNIPGDYPGPGGNYLRILSEDGVDTDYNDAVFALEWGKRRPVGSYDPDEGDEGDEVDVGNLSE